MTFFITLWSSVATASQWAQSVSPHPSLVSTSLSSCPHHPSHLLSLSLTWPWLLGHNHIPLPSPILGPGSQRSNVQYTQYSAAQYSLARLQTGKLSIKMAAVSDNKEVGDWDLGDNFSDNESLWNWNSTPIKWKIYPLDPAWNWIHSILILDSLDKPKWSKNCQQWKSEDHWSHHGSYFGSCRSDKQLLEQAAKLKLLSESLVNNKQYTQLSSSSFKFTKNVKSASWKTETQSHTNYAVL